MNKIVNSYLGTYISGHDLKVLIGNGVITITKVEDGPIVDFDLSYICDNDTFVGMYNPNLRGEPRVTEFVWSFSKGVSTSTLADRFVRLYLEGV